MMIFIDKKILDKIVLDIKALSETVNNSTYDLSLQIKEKIEEQLDKIPHKDTIKEEILLEVDKRLMEFHKEIADKYFESLANFIRWNKELAIVQYVKDKTGDTELGKIKLELMKPYLDEKYMINRAEQAEKINQTLQSTGELIRKRKQELYDEYIKLQREGKNFNDSKVKYEILQELFGN